MRDRTDGGLHLMSAALQAITSAFNSAGGANSNETSHKPAKLGHIVLVIG